MQRRSGDYSQDYNNLPRKLSGNFKIHVFYQLLGYTKTFLDYVEEASDDEDKEQNFHNSGST